LDYNLSIKLYNYFIIKKEYENVFDLLRKVEISIKRKIIINKDSVILFFKASHELKSDELFEKGQGESLAFLFVYCICYNTIEI